MAVADGTVDAAIDRPVTSPLPPSNRRRHDRHLHGQGKVGNGRNSDGIALAKPSFSAHTTFPLTYTPAATLHRGVRPPATRKIMNRFLPLTVTTLTAIAITGCAAERPSLSDASLPVIQHIHGIVADPRGEDLFVATHGGILTLAPDGEMSGPIAGEDLDAMGFTLRGETFFASGHPGTQTPSELGAPNLGIIRSDDFGETWSPVSLTGSADFHVLTAGPDGTLYGLASSNADLLVSTDDGRNWFSGAALSAVDLAATEEGIYAAAEQGLLRSSDRGATFAAVEGAPLLYSLAPQPDGTIAGIGTDDALWVQAADGAWERRATLSGAAQAFTITDDGRFIVADERGIVEITPETTTIIAPSQ